MGDLIINIYMDGKGGFSMGDKKGGFNKQGGGGGNPDAPMSIKQKNYLLTLAKEKGVKLNLEELDKMNSGQASAKIEELKSGKIADEKKSADQIEAEKAIVDA